MYLRNTWFKRFRLNYWLYVVFFIVYEGSFIVLVLLDSRFNVLGCPMGVNRP